MKRREFMRTLSFGTAGLLGLERLIRAMTGQPLPASEICSASEVIYACLSPVEPLNAVSSSHGCSANFNCSNFQCKKNFNCGGGNNGVTCGDVDTLSYNFGCTNFQCQSNFNCYDVQCRQGTAGDFDCRDRFDCATTQARNAQFSCEGTDSFDAQFNCHNLFTCYDGGGQRVWCEDFWCNRGDFWCYQPFSCSSNNYDCGSGFSCTPTWTCPTNPYHN